jgi:hypothetical protein
VARWLGSRLGLGLGIAGRSRLVGLARLGVGPRLELGSRLGLESWLGRESWLGLALRALLSGLPDGNNRANRLAASVMTGHFPSGRTPIDIHRHRSISTE